jgi:hypothetical protein
MGGSSGGSSSSGTTQVRYAPYIEEHHGTFLDVVASERATAITASPFSGYTDIEVDDAFFGAGYLISSFPSLYDMYGKFMAGLDIEALWDQIFDSTIDGTVTKNLVSAEADLLDDDIETTVIPRMQVGMRDINAVMGSSYVIQRAVIEDTRVKALAKFSAELKYRLIPVAEARWSNHLTWNRGVVDTYAQILKFYYAAKIDVDDKNYSMATKDLLWPFTVLEYERIALAAMQGAINTQNEVAGASKASKVLGGALTGAAAGAMMGSAAGGIGAVPGAAIGGVLGAAAGLLS